MIEKHIIFKEIQAKFTKDFDTFGKMDPFLVFKAGEISESTQVADNGGKQPKWTTVVNLKITNQREIEVKAFDKDVTEDQYMGVSKISISTLKNPGQLKLNLVDAQNNSIGQAFLKYQIKQSKAQTKNPNNIIIQQINAKFTKNLDTFGKMEPFIVFKIGQQQEKTQVTQYKQSGNSWVKIIHISYKNQQKQLKVKAFDQDATEDEQIGAIIIDLLTLKATGKYQGNIFNEKKQNIGTLNFKYQNMLSQAAIKRIQQAANKKQPIKQEPKKQELKSQTQITKPKQQKIVQQKKVAPEQKKIEEKKNQPKKPQQKKQQKKVEEQIKLTDKVGKKLTQLSERKVTQKQQVKEKKPHQIEKTSQRVERNVPIQSHGGNSNSNRPTQMQSISGQGSLNRSRDTLRLPNIGDVSRNYGDKIFDKQSSATLQKSILVFSVPKAPRFGNGPKYAGQPSYYVDTCFKPNSTKGVGFGFGVKKQFPQWLQKNMKQNPSPSAYFDDKRVQFRSKGPTFGISHKYYEKVFIPKQISPEKGHIIKSNQRLKPIIRTG